MSSGVEAGAGRDRTTVLRIVGHGRSGSTVVGSLLGARPGTVFAGEVGQAWAAFATPEWQCGCGSTVAECRFWPEVRRAAFGRQEPDFERLRETAQRRVRLRPGSFWRMRRPLAELDEPEREYAEALGRLYAGIGAVSGAQLIIDSSSSTPGCLLAARAPGTALYGLQLVRDPRGVAHSMSRPVAHLPGHGKGLSSCGPIWTALRWQVRNALAESMVRPRLEGYLLMAYEGFCVDPSGALDGIADLTGHEALRWGMSDAPQLELGAGHPIDGNPRVLARRGTVSIGLDERWRDEMDTRARRLATISSLPMSARYGYVPGRAP